MLKITDANEGGGGLSGGAIGGIVGGLIGGFLILGIAGFLLYRNQAKRNQIPAVIAPVYDREEHDQGYNEPEPKPFTSEETRPAIRYPDFDETGNQEENEPAGGRLRYPE